MTEGLSPFFVQPVYDRRLNWNGFNLIFRLERALMKHGEMLVRTDIVDGVDLSIDTPQRNLLSFEFHESAAPLTDLREPGNLHKIHKTLIFE